MSNMPNELIKEEEHIKLMIGDVSHSVFKNDITPETTLNEYLRDMSSLTGTKVTCREGGCGVCIVAAEIIHPVTKQAVTVAVNSCLIPLYCCSGWKIRTIEGIGSSQTGYHPIQKTLAAFNGTQCGFCSPGMVMTMYSLYQRSGNLTMAEVENSFGGNLCRCTGYRSILAAFKSLTVDASVENIGKYPTDIEEFRRCTINDCITKCQNQCKISTDNKIESVCYVTDKAKWYAVNSVNEIIQIFNFMPLNETYTLVAGGTGKGVYDLGSPFDVYIDVNRVVALKNYEIKPEILYVGGNITMTDVMSIFTTISNSNNMFTYLKKIVKHLDLVATLSVRNVGTLAGNLMLKHKHNEFYSDIFLLLVTVGASLTMVDKNYSRTIVRAKDFLMVSMDKKIIERISFPALDANISFETYKIMPRAQNAEAFVNAGFIVKEPKNIRFIRIFFGGINPKFIRAAKTENYLRNKNLFDINVLQSALNVLDSELFPNEVKPLPSAAYRRGLAKALLYKFALSIFPKSNLKPNHASGGAILERPLSKGVQEFETQTSMYPITQPINKLEGIAQTSGEAQFIYDLPDLSNQLYASFVLLKCKPKSVITKVDATDALKLNGVVAYFGKEHIPGVNSFTPLSPENAFYTKNEEIFCSGVVKYFDQPIGIIVAKSWKIAEEGAKLVKVSYTVNDYKPSIITRDTVMNNHHDNNNDNEDFVILNEYVPGNVKDTVLKGEINVNTQFHFHMETLCAQVVPTEDGFDIFPSSQYMDYAQNAVAFCLGISNNKINVQVRRIGGGFGAKMSRSNIVSCAAAIAAYQLRKPVKMLLPLDTNMRMIGKRTPNYGKYETTVDSSGIIKHVNFNYLVDLGAEGGNESPIFFVDDIILSTYGKDKITIKSGTATSDIPTTTYCRAPGSADGLGLLEGMMEEVAYAIGMDPLEFRIKNIDTVNHKQILDYINEFKVWADIDERKKAVVKFNNENRWKKKGLSVVLMTFGMPSFIYYPFLTFVAIYNTDGTVAVSHGGIEMGQGVNTKVAQVTAHELGIPLEIISIKPSNNLTGANSYFSGGSITSEACCFGAAEACKILNERITPVKNKMPAGSTWPQIIRQCNKEGVNLTATGIYTGLPAYSIYGIAASEVTVDILTGQHIIDRTDILEDVGSTINPYLDIGQVEGAFVMGIGLWTLEKIVFDENGENLTHNTWRYKIPGALDIPVEFNVKFPVNAKNPNGVFNSKSAGEPAVCLALVIPLAIRNAVGSARKEANPNSNAWYPLDGPSTIEDTFLNSLHNSQQYTY